MKRFLIAIGVCACMGMQVVHAELTTEIQLFCLPDMSNTGDDPGSSTVDPVDPNQLTAELKGNTLTVYENLEGVVSVSVRSSTGTIVLSQVRFEQFISVALPEPGIYEIHLFHPETRSVYGKFRYTAAPQKMMQNGQMSIRYNNCDYTPNGAKIY